MRNDGANAGSWIGVSITRPIKEIGSVFDIGSFQKNHEAAGWPGLAANLMPDQKIRPMACNCNGI